MRLGKNSNILIEILIFRIVMASLLAVGLADISGENSYLPYCEQQQGQYKIGFLWNKMTLISLISLN